MQTREDALREQRFRQIRLDVIQQYKAATLAGLLVDGRSNRAIQRFDGAQRNGPCPCGSGKKFKRCCRTVEVSKLTGRLP